MKNTKIPISLYILIPLIFSGLSLISAIVSYNLALHYTLRGTDAAPYILAWIAVMVLLTLGCSFIIISMVMKPIVKFIKSSQANPVLALPKSVTVHEEKTDPQYYGEVLDKVTEVIGKLEAKELFPEIVGQTLVMRNLFTQLLKVAPTDSTVLMTGESGTGKELVATAIYEHSLRKNKPFIKLNCVAIPEGLLESELFGHEKGAFTGAVAQKKGKFELAEGGTIFLDEIGDMLLATQAKLLRVLQEREFERVGGNRSLSVDVRFIAATNKKLEVLVKEGKFREDLYFRLNVFPIYLPPLRERTEDIPLLCRHFLAGSTAMEIATPALQLLIGYSWPGNIRELRNAIERATVLAGDGLIELNHLPSQIVKKGMNETSNMGETETLDERVRNLERGLIVDALTRSGGVQVKAAALLGINPRSLWHRVKKLEIDVSSLKL